MGPVVVVTTKERRFLRPVVVRYARVLADAFGRRVTDVVESEGALTAADVELFRLDPVAVAGPREEGV